MLDAVVCLDSIVKFNQLEELKIYANRIELYEFYGINVIDKLAKLISLKLEAGNLCYSDVLLIAKNCHKLKKFAMNFHDIDDLTLLQNCKDLKILGLYSLTNTNLVLQVFKHLNLDKLVCKIYDEMFDDIKDFIIPIKEKSKVDIIIEQYQCCQLIYPFIPIKSKITYSKAIKYMPCLVYR